jgi:hypothetical protein
MSAATRAKADRLLAEGRVAPQPNPVQEFRVEGDGGIYRCFVGPTTRYCTCPHGVHEAEGDCSHLEAAVSWVMGEGILAANGDGLPTSGRALRQLDNRAALARRRARDMERAEGMVGRPA